ncbi:MAG: hypothetical protein AAGD38_00990 [Acidobacteriota bacterium]
MACVVAALAITWPLAQQLDEGIPLGTEPVVTVPIFNLWSLAWNVDRLPHLYDGYWHAPIFHPTTHAFALSEPQPLTGLLASLLTAIGLSILAAYNVILIVALALNALLAIVVARSAGTGWFAALVGGGIILLLPFVHQELGVLQLVSLAGVLWLTRAIIVFAREPGWQTGLELSVAMLVAYAISAQTAIFAVLVLAPVALWLWRKQLSRRHTYAWLGAAVVVFIVVAAPILLAQSAASEDFVRSIETVRKQSAQPSHYLSSAWPQTIPFLGVETAERPSTRAFWPGTLKVLLALIVGLGFGLRNRRFRPAAIALGIALIGSWLLSLGANASLGGISPASVLRTLPGLEQLRSYFRFALFVQLAVAGCVVLAVEMSMRAWRIESRRLWAGVLVLALLAVFELRPTMGTIQPLPPLDLDLPWLTYIETSTDADAVLAFVPFPPGRTARDYVGTAQWMYWQMRHWRPMVNGYSGFFPSDFRALKKRMESFPSSDSLDALAEAGVTHIIVHRAFVSPDRMSELTGRLDNVFADDPHALDIYTLQSE